MHLLFGTNPMTISETPEADSAETPVREALLALMRLLARAIARRLKNESKSSSNYPIPESAGNANDYRPRPCGE